MLENFLLTYLIYVDIHIAIFRRYRIEIENVEASLLLKCCWFYIL